MKTLAFSANQLTLSFSILPDAPVKLTVIHVDADKPNPAEKESACMVELQATGANFSGFHGKKYVRTAPANALRYVSHRKEKSRNAAWIEIVQEGGGLRVTSHFHFIGKEPAFRTWTTVENLAAKPLLIEFVSSLSIAGFAREGKGHPSEKLRLHVADNNWAAESQWRSGSLSEFGFQQLYGDQGWSCVALSGSNQGTWSTAGQLPLGVLENTATQQSRFWQIEHNGSWHWEIGDDPSGLYLSASGPTYREGLWSKQLKKGDVFESVPVSYGIMNGGVQEALRALTQIRRITRRKHFDNEKLPVIFNDFMNCLMGDPTEAKLLPLIEKAVRAGCEYFVIDAGWYAEVGEKWSATVGEWLPSKTRFPNGLGSVIEAIRKHGMVPGLWLELEVMGVDNPLAAKLPDDWFFLRNGIRVADNDRYQLDFRNPAVRKHADQIIDRLVNDYQLGYIKMDYNANNGPGTDAHADAPGDGLLEHNRAYLKWLAGVFDRYPQLIIENCGSGGMRMDYAMLNQHSIQSVTDQTNYRYNGLIAAGCAGAVTPEQAAIWSYPLPTGDEEETIFNMVNALLLRIHQSGCLLDLSDRRFQRVVEGIAVYKQIRGDIRNGLPFWPLGLPHVGDGWIAYGLDCGKSSYLAVWRMGGKEKTCSIPLPSWKGKKAQCECIYPTKVKECFDWNSRTGNLEVALPKPYTARLFRLK